MKREKGRGKREEGRGKIRRLGFVPQPNLQKIDEGIGLRNRVSLRAEGYHCFSCYSDFCLLNICRRNICLV